MSHFFRVVVEACASWSVMFFVLFIINPAKAAFPSALIVMCLVFAAALEKATIAAMIKNINLRVVVFGSVFLLLFTIRPIFHNWRENIYIIPVVVATVVLLVSLNKFIGNKISKVP